MPKKKNVRQSLAKKRQARNSTGARSTSGVGKKSKRSVKFYTPSTATLSFLAELGLVIPEPVDADAPELPFDLTGLSSIEIGQQHSHWAVRHSHAIFEAAKIQQEFQMVEHQIRMRRARFITLHAPDYKTKFHADAAFENAEENGELLTTQILLKAKLAIVGALCDSYEGFRNAASREMSRRYSEQAPKD